MENEKDLIQRAIAGDQMAYRELYQIHDELLFDAIPSEVEKLKEIVVDVMENVIRLSVPLTVECSAGKNWLEAH